MCALVITRRQSDRHIPSSALCLHVNPRFFQFQTGFVSSSLFCFISSPAHLSLLPLLLLLLLFRQEMIPSNPPLSSSSTPARISGEGRPAPIRGSPFSTLPPNAFGPFDPSRSSRDDMPPRPTSAERGRGFRGRGGGGRGATKEPSYRASMTVVEMQKQFGNSPDFASLFGEAPSPPSLEQSPMRRGGAPQTPKRYVVLFFSFFEIIFLFLSISNHCFFFFFLLKTRKSCRCSNL